MWGTTFWWLHSVSYVLLWAGLLSVFLASLMLYRRLLKETRGPSHVSKDISVSTPTLTAIERVGLITVILAFLALVQNVFLIHQRFFFDSDIYRDHDLLVTQVVGQYSWMVQKPDGTAVRLDFCNNFDVSKMNPEPGYTIAKIVAEDRGECLNLLPGNKYLISWKKGPNGWAEKEF